MRKSLRNKSKYELVCGHRRYEAAKLLQWKTIRAEVVEITDKKMIEESLIENVQHEDLSDFEKALVFDRMSRECDMTYDEIGRTVGISKQTVSNYIAMLRLFESEQVKKDPDLLDMLRKITEHHARVLLQVQDENTRQNLIRMVAKEDLSVKDLRNLVIHLRSWFKPSEDHLTETFDGLRLKDESSLSMEKERVLDVLREECRLVNAADFEAFERLHLIDQGFSMYSAFPPYTRYEGSFAVSKHREWFQSFSSTLKKGIEKVWIDVLGDVAVVTLIATYAPIDVSLKFRIRSRATIVLVRKGESWKILHEHYSSLDSDQSQELLAIERSTGQRRGTRQKHR